MAAEVLQQLPQLEALCERLYNSQVRPTDWQLFTIWPGAARNWRVTYSIQMVTAQHHNRS
jgi:hypothetical protein